MRLLALILFFVVQRFFNHGLAKSTLELFAAVLFLKESNLI
jgi:hypothetical protein